jgi:hypothetical protein
MSFHVLHSIINVIPICDRLQSISRKQRDIYLAQVLSLDQQIFLQPVTESQRKQSGRGNYVGTFTYSCKLLVLT